MKKYHFLLVIIHWIMAIMLIMAIAGGQLYLGQLPHDHPEKAMALGGHFGFGLTVGVLLLIRLITRLKSTHPMKATTGNDLLDRLGVWTHWGFYVLISCMVLTGISTALISGIFPLVYGAEVEIPENLSLYPTRVLHSIISLLLAALIVLHILAAFYHQFILKDRLLGRMWFGKRS